MRLALRFVFAFAIAALSAGASADYFQNEFFDVTTGRVGYHLVSWSTTKTWDVPPGCGQPQIPSMSVQGDLPPGLQANTTLPQISGTPRQPGDWDVIVTLHDIWCQNTKEHFGDRVVNVHFHIDP